MQALLIRGRAEAGTAARAEDDDDARWKAIRKYFVSANRIETEYAEPLIRFHESFGLAGRSAPANAEDGLLYAHVLAPYDDGVRFTAARVQLARKDTEAARKAIAPLAYNPHGGRRAAFALRIVEAIDRGDIAAAQNMTGQDPGDIEDEEEKD